MSLTESDYKKINAAMRTDPSLAECFLEMIDAVEHSDDRVKTGDDAEEAVVDVIRKTGQTLLEKWAQRKELQAKSMADLDPELRPHQKKTSDGKPPWEISSSWHKAI